MNSCKIIITIILAIQLFVQPIAVLANIKTVIDPKRQVATMVYDNLDRLDTATYKDNLLANDKLKFKYEYDAEDNLKFVTETNNINAVRTYSREYDARNRLKNTTDAFGKVVKFDYDKANNLTKLTDAVNRETVYEYDAKNQLDKVKQNNISVANYDWLKDGLLDKVTYQNGTTRNYVYDSADRVSSITNNFSNSLSESFAYGYDANSNRITETKAATNQVTKNIGYQYDSLDRLSQVKTTTPTTSQIDYTYDAVGNRRTEIGTDQFGSNVNRQASYDDLNQLKTLANGNITESFNYDDNGNLIETKLNNSIVAKYEYDIRNQLTKAENGANTELARFDYDFERKRTSKTSYGSTTNYTYAGNQVVNETNNNVISASYTIGGGEIVKSEFVANGESNFHFTDALGSVTSLTNNAGSLTSRSDYDAFGLQTGGSSSNSIGYTGQRLDSETGLMALGNGERYYSPSYARFIQQDSVSGNNSMPQSLNRFAYGLNNPNKFSDPSGNEPDAIQQGFRDANQYMANNSTGNWYLDATANFYLRMQQAGYSAVKGFYNAGKEILNTVADGVTYVAADAMGIELKDMKFSSKLAQGIQQQRMSGKSAWDIATDGNVIANVATLGVYGTIQNVGTNMLDLSEGKISMDEYTEKMGEMAGEQIFDLVTMGGRKGSGAIRATEEGVSSLKTSFKTLAKSGKEALGNLKQSVKAVTKDFVEGYKAAKVGGTYLGAGAGGLQGTLEKVGSGISKAVTGSLERSYTKKLWSNLGKDAVEGYAVHHLLPVKGAGIEKLSIMQKAKQLGYDINNKNNLMGLPRTAELAIKDALPLHSGKHLAEYFDNILDRVNVAEKRYKKGLLKEEGILNEIENIENGVRKDLLDGKVRLQENCSNYCGGR